jgi:hypothetical protein
LISRIVTLSLPATGVILLLHTVRHMVTCHMPTLCPTDYH